MTGDSQYKAEEVNEWLVQINNCADRGILFIAGSLAAFSHAPGKKLTEAEQVALYVSQVAGK